MCGVARIIGQVQALGGQPLALTARCRSSSKESVLLRLHRAQSYQRRLRQQARQDAQGRAHVLRADRLSAPRLEEPRWQKQEVCAGGRYQNVTKSQVASTGWTVHGLGLCDRRAQRYRALAWRYRFVFGTASSRFKAAAASIVNSPPTGPPAH